MLLAKALALKKKPHKARGRDTYFISTLSIQSYVEGAKGMK